ncbi:MAG: DUF4440 domain-containing protein [Planctomycetota bacterium]
MDDLLNLLRDAEIELHQRSTRCDRSRVDALLHESFVEFGRSGTRYDKNSILSFLERDEERGTVLSQDYAVAILSADAALLTYKSAIVDDSNEVHQFALRSSIWLKTADSWNLRFHQGTPTDPFAIEETR